MIAPVQDSLRMLVFPFYSSLNINIKKTKVKVESERGTELRMAAVQSACLVMDNDFKVS